MGEKVENIMDRKIREMKTMRQVLEKFEEYLEGKRVFRYMEGNSVRDVFADQFFLMSEEQHLCFGEKDLSENISALWGATVIYGWFVCALCSGQVR